MSTELFTVDEIAAVTGHSVRNIRYYASLGLVPPPAKQGRIALYGPTHRARLELISALQEHGFTLEAIGRYLERLGEQATAEDLAVQRAMITSWTHEAPAEVELRIGRELRALGLPKDALAAAHEATVRHMEALAVELDVIFRDRIVEPFQTTQHSPVEVERFERGLPKLRELTVEAVVVAFQGAVNRVISRSLDRVR